MLIRARPRARVAVLATTIAAAAGVLFTSGVASAATVTIPQQGGNHTLSSVSPGSTVVAGYDFEYVAGKSTIIKSGSAVLSVACTDNSTPTQSSITIPMPYQEYLSPASNSNGWVPSGDQTSPSVYQGSLVLPDLCSGGTMTIGQSMGPFTADVYSDAGQGLNFRWHYALGSDLGSSWSATKSVTPDPLSAVPMAESLGRWAPIGLVALFAGVAAVVFTRQRRRIPARSS